MIALAQLLTVQWLLASVGGLVAATAAWLLLNGAARLWPALRTQRAVWLAAQAVVAVTILLPFLPRPTQISATPPITLPAAAPMSMSTSAPMPDATPAATKSSISPEPAPATPRTATATATAAPMSNTQHLAHVLAAALPLLAALWLTVYCAGLALTLLRRRRALRLWRDLLATAEYLSPAMLRNHGAFSDLQLRQIAQGGLTVARTEAAISPMLTGIRRPLLLLPAHLDALSREQQQMIIAHELQHWRMRDPLYLAIAAALQTLFWFIPALRWMATQMAWALELQCDQHVLRGRPQHQRKQYAAALLQQWSTLMPTAAAAFGGATVTARIRQMQQNGLPALSVPAAWLTATALAAIVASIALLQPALAYSVPQHGTAAIETTTPAAASAATSTTAQSWRAPLDKVRVTGFYGVMRSVLPTPHKGIDFAAARGTPVHATADGTVIAAGPIAENKGRYGNVVIIDHGAQQSLYAHLDRVNVRPGQRLRAGDVIGAVGSTGFATGPHLHLELRQNGHILDPAPRFENLDAYATPRALSVRRQQLSAKG